MEPKKSTSLIYSLLLLSPKSDTQPFDFYSSTLAIILIAVYHLNSEVVVVGGGEVFN